MKGHITFSMPTSSTQERWIEIKVEDELSGTQFLTVKMDPATFALATVGNLGYADCDFELYAANVGKVRETKTELVLLGWKYTEDEKEAALAGFEVDGWKANRRDIGNHHKRNKAGDGWHVSFIRFVEATDGTAV